MCPCCLSIREHGASLASRGEWLSSEQLSDTHALALQLICNFPIGNISSLAWSQSTITSFFLCSVQNDLTPWHGQWANGLALEWLLCVGSVVQAEWQNKVSKDHPINMCPNARISCSKSLHPSVQPSWHLPQSSWLTMNLLQVANN